MNVKYTKKSGNRTLAEGSTVFGSHWMLDPGHEFSRVYEQHKDFEESCKRDGYTLDGEVITDTQKNFLTGDWGVKFRAWVKR